MPVNEEDFLGQGIPQCQKCLFPLKPNVVLFGESVRGLPEVNALVNRCDLLMVIGTSAQVFPAAELPLLVKQQGGLIFEFNLEHTRLSTSDWYSSQLTDFFIQGDVCDTLPRVVREVEA